MATRRPALVLAAGLAAAVVLAPASGWLGSPPASAAVPPPPTEPAIVVGPTAAPDPAASTSTTFVPIAPSVPTTTPLTAPVATVGPGADEDLEEEPEANLPSTVPVPSLPPIEDPDAQSAPLIPMPASCPTPRQEQAVFLGTLVVHDGTTARFVVGTIRSGSLDGFTVAGLVDVRYGDEARFLEPGTTYVVGAAIDERSGVLSSTVRAPAPLFGGNEVAGVSATEVVCPTVDDPVRTLLVDGTSVESGLIRPLADAQRELLRAVLQPIGVALAVLIGLASLKLLLFAAVRSMRDLGERHPRTP